MENIIKKLKTFAGSREFWPVMSLLLVLIFNFIFTKNFFVIEIKDGHLYGSLIDILNRAAPLMLISIGMTMVIATKGIDISVGSVMAISGAVAATLIGGSLEMVNGANASATAMPLPLVIFIALAVSAIFGMWNGALVSRIEIQPVVATLILLTAGRGIAQLLTQGQIITIYYTPYQFIGAGYLLGLPFSIYIVAAVFAFTMYLTRKTALGLFIESIGINQVASRFSGIKVKSITFWTYAFCGVCAGLAGLIYSSNVKCADGNNAGLFIEMDAILAVALGGNSLDGGRFSLVGSLIGALFLQSITTTIYAIGVPPEITYVVKAIVVIAICLIQSEEFRKAALGKFARNRRELSEKAAVKS
jgi:simple sugar transport system permease protein